jgi:peptide/nickel transport system substrate-binding protein
VCRTDRPPFNDLRVRRALQMSYESQLFVDTVLRKKGAVLPALQWPVAFDAPPQLADLPEHWRYNPDRAKQLLLEAGLHQGIDVPYLYYSYGPVHDQWVQFIQNQMKDVGFRMNVQQVDYATYTDMYNNAKYEGCVLMVGFLSPTVDSMTYGLMHSKSPRNNARFNDPALDKLLEAQRAETDPIKRRDILKQIWDYEVNEAVRLPMPAQQSWTYWSGKLQGVGTNAVLTFPLYNASQWEVAWRTQ